MTYLKNGLEKFEINLTYEISNFNEDRVYIHTDWYPVGILERTLKNTKIPSKYFLEKLSMDVDFKGKESPIDVDTIVKILNH